MVNNKAEMSESSEMAFLAPFDYAKSSGIERSVKSAERTLALFELFSLHQCPLTVGQISTLLNIPQPSVTMLVRNFVKLGYLEHDRVARTFLPTIRIMLLGSWVHRRFQAQNDLENHLDSLLQKCDETILLGLQNSLYCQYVCALLPNKPNHLEIQSGMVRPLTKTAIGQVLLSKATDQEISLVVRRCNAEFDQHLQVNLSEFMVLIDRVRRNGYAETAGDMTPGRGVIAVSIPTPLGNMPMAVGVGAPIERMTAKHEHILDSLRQFQNELRMSAPDAKLAAA